MMLSVKYGLVLMLLIGTTFGYAQANGDSLAVFALISKSRQIQDHEEAIRVAKLADEEANKYGLYTRTAAARNLIAAYFQNRQSYEGLRRLLELNNALELRSRWADISQNLVVLADYYANQNLYASAAEKYREAAELAQEHNVPFDIWQNALKIGDLEMQQNKFESALKEYNRALGILQAKKSAPSSRFITNWRKIAQALNSLKDYDAAITANLEVLKLLEQTGDRESYAAQLNNIGYTYHKRQDYIKALDYFLQTLKAREQLGYKDKDHVDLLINIGITCQNLDRSQESEAYLVRALNASTDLAQKAHINDLLAIAMISKGESLRAREYNKLGMAQARQAGDKYAEAEAWYTSAIINEKLLAYQIALSDFKRYLHITDSLQKGDVARQQELAQAEYAIERTQGEIQTLIASNQIKDYQIAQLRLERENQEKALKIQEAEAKAKLQALQLERSRLEAEAKEREVAVLKAKEENQRLLLEQQRLQESKAVQELKLAEEQNRVQELQLEKQNAANRNLVIVLGLSFIVLLLIIYALWRTYKSNKELSISREIILQERDRSDNLLLNILPESTANELKTKGSAPPKRFESASVFFSDFKSFSAHATNYTPNELLEELELFFGGFDRIISKYGIEKIKTIGDAYMCAAGLPNPDPDHALKMVGAALEMLDYARSVNVKQIERGREPWHLRIGINSGPVVAGVIGTKKFIYDIWGDTVNLASRLETAGEAGKINISDNTRDLIKDTFETSYRGEIEVKNMGKVAMYFVVAPNLDSTQAAK